MTERLYVFAYDISSNRLRRRIATALEERAVRVQGSVFEARLSAPAATALAKELARDLGPGDSLKVYAIGASGLRNCLHFGAALPPVQGDYLFV